MNEEKKEFKPKFPELLGDLMKTSTSIVITW